MYAFFVAVKMSNAARTNVDVRHLEAAEKLTFFGLEVQNMELPCDVKLPPATIIRKGCKMETFIRALKIRAGKEFELEFKS